MSKHRFVRFFMPVTVVLLVLATVTSWFAWNLQDDSKSVANPAASQVASAQPSSTASKAPSITLEGKTGYSVFQILEQNAIVQLGAESKVVMINGEAAPAGYYWAFEVNGEQGEIAGTTVTKDGDKVRWVVIKAKV